MEKIGASWNVYGECRRKTSTYEEMWERIFSCERSKSKEVSRGCRETEKPEGIQGQWQRESPAKEYLEQVKCNVKTPNAPPRMMKEAFFALKGGDWEEDKNIFRVQAEAAEWAFGRVQEAFEKVAQDEARKLSTVQEDHVQKYRLLAAHHRANRRARRCHECHTCAGTRNNFRLEDYVWWVSAGKKHTSWWCAICGGKYDWRAPNRMLVVQTGESVTGDAFS